MVTTEILKTLPNWTVKSLKLKSTITGLVEAVSGNIQKVRREKSILVGENEVYPALKFHAVSTTEEFGLKRGEIPRCPFLGDSRVTEIPIIDADNVRSTSAVVKSYSEIPSPRGLPLIGTQLDLLWSGSVSRLHLYCHKRHQELGPIYTEKLGVIEAVFVGDSQLIHHIYRNEGKYPRHLVPEAWIIYNQITNNKRGLFFMDGTEWFDTRKTLNSVFLRAFDSERQGSVFNDIVSDVIGRWKTRRQDGELPELEKELYRWSIESLCTMIFGKRIGCLSQTSSKDIETFVDSTQHIFMESAKMTMIPPKLAYKLRLPSLVEDTVAEMDVTKDDSMLAHLLNENVDQETLVRIVTDLIVAAADTTSHAVQWALYLVAKNGDWQEKMAAEIDSVVPKGEMVEPHHIKSLPLIRAAVKESLRLYPVAPLLTRYLSKDLNVGGYHIPEGLILMSLYTIGRDEKSFDDPHCFKPSRWVKSESNERITGNKAFLPFGTGVRACIGRRVAELQMHLLVARTIQQFRMEVANEKEVEIKLRLITTPAEDIRLRLIDRV
ncbi:hypothetical protein CHUAL_005980 [Chamberlinius hualienensis]